MSSRARAGEAIEFESSADIQYVLVPCRSLQNRSRPAVGSSPRVASVARAGGATSPPPPVPVPPEVAPGAFGSPPAEPASSPSAASSASLQP
jgi:hypothetical protein